MRARAKERGVAVVVLVGAMVLLGAYFVLANWNFAAVRVERDRVTTEALWRAKEALVAYAAADANRPGELPCPDVDNDGQLTLGVDFGGGGACTSLIGRLPFRTLDLPDLRDDSGERLWYAVSADFRAGNTAIPLNNDTAFRTGHASLSITGVQAASNLAAVVFAPGAPLKREGAAALQQRSGANAVNAVNYLDIASGEDNTDANRAFITAPKSETFNDALLPIHSDDIMWLVQRRAARELAQHLREHYDAWETAAGKGFYPWAAPYADPANMQAGVSGTEHGLLPLNPTPLVWTSASLGCAGVGTPTLTCTGLLLPPLIPLLNITGTVGNIGTGFFQAPTTTPPDVDVLGGLVLLGGSTASWTVNAPAQSLNFSYVGTGLAAGIVTVQVRAPVASPWLASSWLVTNRWYSNAYYAVAPAYAVTGAGSCGTCLTVANTAAASGKQAVVVMTGRALPGQSVTRLTDVAPPLNQFLESGNQTPVDRIFESNAVSTAFNDFALGVRP
jgi:hypothetical protein